MFEVRGVEANVGVMGTLMVMVRVRVRVKVGFYGYVNMNCWG